jgi:hypothetical protein
VRSLDDLSDPEVKVEKRGVSALARHAYVLCHAAGKGCIILVDILQLLSSKSGVIILYDYRLCMFHCLFAIAYRSTTYPAHKPVPS